MIGVLALQGDFEAHVDALRRAGVAAREVRGADEILKSRGLVLPGGESTTFRKLMNGTGIEDAIRTVARRGNSRGADEDRLERLFAKGSRRDVRESHDGRVELPSVGVAHDRHRQEAEPL